MAAIMMITMLPMSAFADQSWAGDSGIYSSDAAGAYTFAVSQDRDAVITHLAKQLVEVKLTEGATFNALPTARLSGMQTVTDVTERNLSADKTVFSFVIPADEIKDAAPHKGTLKVESMINFEDVADGAVVKANVTFTRLEAADSARRTLTGKELTVGTVNIPSSDALAISVTNKEKVVSFDGGLASSFKVTNFSSLGTTTEDTFVVELDDEEYAFVNGDRHTVLVDGKKFTYEGTHGDHATGEFIVKDGKIVFLKGDITKDTKSIVITPEIEKMGRKADTGDIKVYARMVTNFGLATAKNKASNSAVIGKVVDYSVTMTVVEKGKKEIPSIWGGEEVDVKVTLKGPKGSFLNRAIDFSVEGAKVKQSSNTKLSGKVKDGYYVDGEFSYSDSDLDTKTEISFFITVTAAAHKDGVATITAAQRAWEVKADLLKSTPKFAVTADTTAVKKGEAKTTANVVITEAKAGLLEKNDKLQISFNTRRDYTQFTTKDIKVEATNGMKFGDPEFVQLDLNGDGNNSKYVTVQVSVTKPSSGEPAVITISGVKVLVDGSSTDDVIKVDGRLNGSRVSSADYIKVVREYDYESTTTVFTINQTGYTVNGEAKTVAQAPFIKNNRTMLPIRAVAESLGLQVQWNGLTKTASFTNSDKVAAVTIGQEVLYVNGTPIPLSAKAELINGTTFVELHSLATAFGVQIAYDAATKQVIVSK